MTRTPQKTYRWNRGALSMQTRAGDKNCSGLHHPGSQARVVARASRQDQLSQTGPPQRSSTAWLLQQGKCSPHTTPVALHMLAPVSLRSLQHTTCRPPPRTVQPQLQTWLQVPQAQPTQQLCNRHTSKHRLTNGAAADATEWAQPTAAHAHKRNKTVPWQGNLQERQAISQVIPSKAVVAAVL
jgi:hypothetical protein